MSKVQALVITGFFSLSSIAQAEEIRPGLWKISLESTVAVSPGWKPQPFELTQCLAESDAKNPAGLLLGMGSPGATGCEFTDSQYSGNTMKFKVSCAGTLGIQGHGEMTYTATTLEGVLDVDLGESDKIDMQNKIRANYLGECPAGSGL